MHHLWRSPSTQTKPKNFDLENVYVGIMKAAIHMGPDCTEILDVYKNTNFEELQNLFDITQKLVHKQGEILNVTMIECASLSWTRSSLAHDEATKCSRAKVRVYSDAALCNRKMKDPAHAHRSCEGQMEQFQQADLTEN